MKIKFNSRVQVKTWIWVIAFFAFFEPLSFDSFVSEGLYVNLFHALSNICLVIRLVVSTYAYLVMIGRIQTQHLHKYKGAKYISLFVIAQTLVYCINGGFTVNLILALYYYFAFILICYDLYNSNKIKFLNVIYCTFIIYFILGFASILIFPNGINNANNTAFATYFLGSKNASFMYFYVFSLVFCIELLSNIKKNKFVIFLILACMTASVVICQSANSLVCLLLITIFCAVYYFHLDKFIRIDVKFWVLGILILAIVIYGGINIDLISDLLYKLGRDSTFTGRAYLWNTAISYFKSSPLIGVGNAKFILYQGTEGSHAHSQYLNILSKNGLFVLSIFILNLIVICRSILKNNDWHVKILLSGFAFVFFLHLMFDVTMNYFIILITVLLSFKKDISK